MKIFVSEECIACHRCYIYYPEVFIKDSNGCAHPKTEDDVSVELVDMAEDAIETCPVGAISCDKQF